MNLPTYEVNQRPQMTGHRRKLRTLFLRREPVMKLKRPWALYRDDVPIGFYETQEEAEAAKPASP